MIEIALLTVKPPRGGVWRIGRQTDPFAFSGPMPSVVLEDSNAGNRFDSPTGDYGVCYFGTEAEVCYAETLACFRPDPLLEQYFEDDDSMGWGELPRDWRERRRLVRASFEPTPERPNLEFVDVEQAQTLRHLEKALAGVLNVYGYKRLNVAVVRGSDRRITRWIGKYIHLQRDEDGRAKYAGIRYLSQLGSNWECWATFDGVGIKRESTSSIALTDETFQKVAELYNLKPY